MEKQFKFSFALALLFSGAFVLGNACGGATPHYLIRSQSVDSARELVGWAQEINLYQPGCCDMYWTKAITFEYTRTFSPRNITQCLFGDSCLVGDCGVRSIRISGSRVEQRGDKDWLADYFGLPTDFQSEITLKPRIENYLVDFNCYVGLDNWCRGMYFRVHAPVVHTKWKLNYQETVTNRGVAGYDGGYFSDGAIRRDALLDRFTDYVVKCKVPELSRGLILNSSCIGTAGEITAANTTVFEPLKCAKWADECCDSLHDTKLSDIIWAFGWNIWQCDDYHVGFNIRGAIPTGTRPNGQFFFEPIVGNGHHWELGVGFTSHYTCWRGCDDERSLGFYVDANVTHLFADYQCRVFDLKGRCNSRYMLALSLGEPVEDLYSNSSAGVQDGATAPNSQFKYHFAPVANLTKERVKVSVGAQVDATFMFNYQTACGNWSFDVGYNIWWRGCEKFRFDQCDPCSELRLNPNKWALKGDSHVFGYTVQNFPACPCVLPTGASGVCSGPLGALQGFGKIIPLSPSQKCATVHEGANSFAGPNSDDGGINGIRSTRNPGVDNMQFAQDQANAAGAEQIVDRYDPTAGGLQTKTSNNPVLLTWDDVDVCGAKVQGLSHKIFFGVNYVWDDECDCWTPYLTLGAEAEFGDNKSGCKTNCNAVSPSNCNFQSGDCSKCAPNQWGVWIKGGISFD